jgi:hypothetical protein
MTDTQGTRRQFSKHKNPRVMKMATLPLIYGPLGAGRAMRHAVRATGGVG